MVLCGKEKVDCGEKDEARLYFTTLLFHPNMIKGEYVTSK